jgi:hypothetical protein
VSLLLAAAVDPLSVLAEHQVEAVEDSDGKII